ncbi:MAG TPA: hypothetical protein VFA18_10205, partial [Gemmataceae bacterium]|nr:hypothetical protein [Gemmataceae bacterium]
MTETSSCPACQHPMPEPTPGAAATRCERCGAVRTVVPAAVFQAVQGPALALRRTGLLGLACSVGLIIYLILRIAWLPSSGVLPPRPMAGDDPEKRPVAKKDEAKVPPRPLPSGIVQADKIYGECWFAIVGPCWAILILASARQMQRLGHYESARMGCVLAMVPLNLAWLVGLPVGIHGLRVLARPEVRQAFASTQSKVHGPM